jgi:DNA-binding transcriptional regulator YiaG
MTDNVEIAKLRMWKAEQLATDLNNWFESQYHTVKDMTDLLRNVSIEGSAVQQWRFLLKGIQRYGFKEWLSLYPNEAREMGFGDKILRFVDDENDIHPWLIEPIRNQFEDTVEQCYIKKFGSLDDLTLLGSTVIIDKTKTDNKWARYSLDQWIDWSRTKGNNATIKGSVKMGKTNLALLLGEYGLLDGAHVKTNIFVPKKVANWEYCVKLSDLIISICKSKLQKKRTLFLMDEAGLFWARIDTIQSVPKDLAKLILVLGKLETNLGFISHFEELVPTIIRRTSVASFEKRSLTSAFVEITAGGFKLEPQIVTHIPATSIPYDQDQLAFFNRDMFVPDLLEHVSTINSLENQWEKLIEYVEQHRGEADETSEISPKQVAKWLRTHPKLSIRKIAELVGVSVSTVHSWVTEGNKELGALDIETMEVLPERPLPIDD